MNANLKLTLAVWPALSLVVTAVCFLTHFLAQLFGIALPAQTSIDFVLNAHGWQFARVCFMVLVFAPVVEEALFRGLLYRLPARFLSGRFFPAYASAIASSVLFSATHYIEMPFPDNAFLALFLFGLIQCSLYRRTGKIWCVMLSHMLFNATTLVLVLLFPEFAKMS